MGRKIWEINRRVKKDRNKWGNSWEINGRVEKDRNNRRYKKNGEK
jgi:hypothetical protein